MQLVKTIIPFQLPENMSSMLVYLTLSCMHSDGYRKKITWMIITVIVKLTEEKNVLKL